MGVADDARWQVGEHGEGLRGGAQSEEAAAGET